MPPFFFHACSAKDRGITLFKVKNERMAFVFRIQIYQHAVVEIQCGSHDLLTGELVSRVLLRVK